MQGIVVVKLRFQADAEADVKRAIRIIGATPGVIYHCTESQDSVSRDIEPQLGSVDLFDVCFSCGIADHARVDEVVGLISAASDTPPYELTIGFDCYLGPEASVSHQWQAGWSAEDESTASFMVNVK